MPGFNNLNELIKVLDWSKTLLSEMFEKRKLYSYRLDHALELLDEAHVETLVQKGILRQNGPHLELDEQYLDFFEQVLEVNEEINTAFITGQIQLIRQQIAYYLQEKNESRQYGYLKAVKSALRKTGRIVQRNIIDLNRNIENTFKAEPSYEVKLTKLKDLDEKRQTIFLLLEQTALLIDEQERTFFATATDDELRTILAQLHIELAAARHNLIEAQKQIIEYLNQVKQQNRIAERIRQLKYLKDQFELTHKSDIQQQLLQRNALVFEPERRQFSRLSLELLQTDAGASAIKKVAEKMRVGSKNLRPVASAIAQEILQTEVEEEVFINLEEIRQGFIASGHHLFAFIMQYRFPREVGYEERVTIFCQLVGMYEDDMHVTETYQMQENLEYAIVRPR